MLLSLFCGVDVLLGHKPGGAVSLTGCPSDCHACGLGGSGQACPAEGCPFRGCGWVGSWERRERCAFGMSHLPSMREGLKEEDLPDRVISGCRVQRVTLRLSLNLFTEQCCYNQDRAFRRSRHTARPC